MFSPSPYPASDRRASWRRGVASPAPRGRLSRLASLGNGPPSRVSTPRRAASTASSSKDVGDISMDSEAASEMEVDAEITTPRERSQKGAILFSRSEQLTVTLHAHVPVEVEEALGNADFVKDSFTGVVDTSTEYCLVASSQTCFVWQYSQMFLGSPTCYIFQCPTESPRNLAPFSSLVSYAVDREPGLILLSPGGELSFWDSIGLGLTGGEVTFSSDLELTEGETVTRLLRAEPSLFIASTTSGRLFSLRVSSTSGKLSVSHHPFSLSRPQSTISRLRFWGSASSVYTPGIIYAAAIGSTSPEGVEVWTCVETNIVKWIAMKEGWEQVDFEINVSDIIVSSIRRYLTIPEIDNETLDLEMVDICVTPQNDLFVLTSFAGPDDDTGLELRLRRYYAIVHLVYSDERLLDEAAFLVPYQTIFAHRANIHPQLSLVDEGAVFAVQFGDVMAFVARDSEYNTALTLKSMHDRTFGCGVLRSSGSLLLMNASVLMKVEVDREKVSQFDPESGKGALIKSIMTQAILYGANEDNPFLFSFPLEVEEESLTLGAEQLTEAVLASDIDVVRPNHDLTRQFIERKDRLRILINFINENGALGKMSQSSRQLLLCDAEKLYSAQQLWLNYSEHTVSTIPYELLYQVVKMFMENHDEGHHDDMLRAFFRLKTRDIGSLLQYIYRSLKEHSTWPSPQQKTRIITDANSITLTILRSAWNYRHVNTGTYGIIPPLLKSWTSLPPIFDLLLLLHEETATILDTDTANSQQNTHLLKDHLSQLTAASFKCYQERSTYLNSSVASGDPGTDVEKRHLEERFQQMRLPLLQTLVKHDMESEAFSLAEEHRDFKSLTDLCHMIPPIYPPSENIHTPRIQSYIERYNDEFMTALYRWYIEHAELRLLFDQTQTYGSYADEFFSKHPQPSVSWIHDLENGRYGKVSETLLSEAGNTSDTQIRHVMLSIGKLCQLAESTQPEDSPANNTLLDAFHDGLDYIAVNEKLLNDLRKALVPGRQRQTLESQVDVITKANTSRMSARKGFIAIFKRCVKTLLQHHILPLEDLLDIVTLRDDPTDQPTAIQLIQAAKDFPGGRRLSTYRTMWRRIFIHDNWNEIRDTVNVTDEQLLEKYKTSALYAAVVYCSQQQDGLSLVIPPIQAGVLPSQEELVARFPGYSDTQLSHLMQDYEEEAKILKDLAVEDVFERVKELAMQEAEQEDVDMSILPA